MALQQRNLILVKLSPSIPFLWHGSQKCPYRQCNFSNVFPSISALGRKFHFTAEKSGLCLEEGKKWVVDWKYACALEGLLRNFFCFRKNPIPFPTFSIALPFLSILPAQKLPITSKQAKIFKSMNNNNNKNSHKTQLSLK